MSRDPIAIADADDPRVADYRELRDPALRHGRGLFVAETIEVVKALLATPRYRVRSLLLTPVFYERLRPLVAERDAAVFLAPTALLESIIGLNFHRGCVALGERGDDPPLDLVVNANAHRMVVLEDVTNPDNLGGIFRTAHVFGMDGLVLSPGCADPLYRKVIRVSVGASLHLPWVRDAQWPHAIALLRDQGFTVAALTTSTTALDLERLATGDVPERLAILVGNEGYGLSAAARAAADVEVTIPMRAGADSLNVGAAVAIALYRLARR